LAASAALVCLLAAGLVEAQSPDAQRKAEACVACHGPSGNSVNPTVPSIAGQVKFYLHWQLILYRDKRRADPQMAPIAAGLSDADTAELAAWFAAQRPAAPPVSADPARVERGQRLAATYHCNDCHGRDYNGGEYAPRLRGFSREYLLQQMRGFKSRTRGDLDGAMTQAAQPVADADVEPLVDYLATLR
jgi:cytochrome c553